MPDNKKNASDKVDGENSDQSDQKKTGTSSVGEDESSTENESDDSHLHEDQKSRKLKT